MASWIRQGYRRSWQGGMMAVKVELQNTRAPMLGTEKR